MSQENLRRVRWTALAAVACLVCGGVAAPARALNYLYGTEKSEYFFNPFEESAAQTVRAWFASWQSGNPLLLGAFVDPKVIFRGNPSESLGHGRDNLLRMVCGSLGGKRNLIDLFVIGGDYDAAVLTRWEETDTQGQVSHMSSFFRVQKGLIVEWSDMPDDAVSPAPKRAGNSDACRAVDTALHPTS